MSTWSRKSCKVAPPMLRRNRCPWRIRMIRIIVAWPRIRRGPWCRITWTYTMVISNCQRKRCKRARAKSHRPLAARTTNKHRLRKEATRRTCSTTNSRTCLRAIRTPIRLCQVAILPHFTNLRIAMKQCHNMFTRGQFRTFRQLTRPAWQPYHNRTSSRSLPSLKVDSQANHQTQSSSMPMNSIWTTFSTLWRKDNKTKGNKMSKNNHIRPAPISALQEVSHHHPMIKYTRIISIMANTRDNHPFNNKNKAIKIFYNLREISHRSKIASPIRAKTA